MGVSLSGAALLAAFLPTAAGITNRTRTEHEEDYHCHHDQWWNHGYEVHHFEEVCIVALVIITLIVDFVHHRLEHWTHRPVLPLEEGDEGEEEEELKSREPLRHVLWTRATAEFTILGMMALVTWVAYKAGAFYGIYELMEDFEDIALPLTAEQYKHNVENVHMHLFITFALYFTIMLGSIIIAENTMQKWALERPSKAILEERRHALGKGGFKFKQEDWCMDFLTMRQTFLDYLPAQVYNSEYFNARFGHILMKYDVQVDKESIPRFLAPWFPFTHYILANYRDLLEHMLQISALSLSAVGVVQGVQALVHRFKIDFDFSFIWVGIVTMIAVGLFFYTRKFHIDLKKGKFLNGHLAEVNWPRSARLCYHLCSVLQICLLVVCFELTRPIARDWPWTLDWWKAISHVFTAVVIMPCAGLLLGHLLARLAIALSVGAMHKKNAARMARILENHLLSLGHIEPGAKSASFATCLPLSASSLEQKCSL